MADKIKQVLDHKKTPVRRKAPDDETLLTEYADMTAQQLADKYGASESTVRTWIRNARARLKKEA